MVKKTRSLCICLALAILLVGCRNSTEINDLAFVMGIGVDNGDNEDEGQYNVTVQIAKTNSLNSSSGESGGGTKDDGFMNFSRSGMGIQLPIYEISRLINRELYTGHTQVIVIGREAAQGDIAPILDHFIRSSDARFTISLLVAQDRADEILDHPSEIENFPASHLQSLIDSHSKTGDIVGTSIIDFLIEMVDHSTAPTIPIVKLVDDGTGDSQIVLDGMAVFKGSTMCDVLSPIQTKVMMAIRGGLNTGFFPIEAFGGHIILRLSNSSSKMRLEYKDGKFRMVVDIVQEFSIVDTTADADFLSYEERDELAAILTDEGIRLFEDTLEHTKTQSLDVFGFGECIRRHYPREARELIENWEEEYPELEVDFNLDIVVLSTGAILKPLSPLSHDTH